MATTEHVGVLNYVDNNKVVHSIYPEIKTDKSLSIEGKAADAKAVGDTIRNNKVELDTTLKVAGKAADAKAVGDAIKDASVSVKYDEDTDYLQVLKNGEWIDRMRMGLLKEYLYIDGLNKGEFYKVGEGTLSLEGNITFNTPYTVGGDHITRYIRTGKTYDLTNFKTIYMTHTTTFTPQNQYVNFTTTYNWAKLEAADPNNNLTVAASNSYATSANTSGVITLDVSELIGEYYIQIGVHGNQMSANVVISEIYIEG